MTTLARTSSNPFDHLWRTHNRTVHRFVRRRCSLSCTDDIVAETFTSAAAALSGGQDIDIGWLMTVARRRIADYWRSHERDQRILAQAQAVPALRELPPLVEDETTDLVEGLPARQREALILRYGLDLSVSEVAAHLGVGYSTAESLLGRGRSNLRKRIGARTQIAGTPLGARARTENT